MKPEDQIAELHAAPQPAVSGASGELREAPGLAVSVRLDLQVTQLGRKAFEAVRSSSAIGSEIGGLLLGTVTAGNPTKVAVSGFEPVACDHELGPLYKLSKADLDRLDQAAARIATDGRGLEVVGFFRSHTRPGLAPDTYDLAVCSARFNKPYQITLLVRPGATETTGSGIFTWQGGTLRSYAPPAEPDSRADAVKPAEPANSALVRPRMTETSGAGIFARQGGTLRSYAPPAEPDSRADAVKPAEPANSALVRPSVTETSGAGIFARQGGTLRSYGPPAEPEPRAEALKPAEPPKSAAAPQAPSAPPVREAPRRATVVPIISRRPPPAAAPESKPLPAVAAEASQKAAAPLAAAPPAPVKPPSAPKGQARVGRCSVQVRLEPDQRRAGHAMAGQESRRGL